MMMPKPIRLTKIVRKMMRSGRGTGVGTHSIMRPMPSPVVRRAAASCAAFAATAVLSAQDPLRVPPAKATMRAEIRGTHGIVAGGRHYSVVAGVRMLEQGGNAVDAGVATVLAASVVEISHFGF